MDKITDPIFIKRMEELKIKYPLIQKLYDQGRPYETWERSAPITKQVDKELGISGFSPTPKWVP